MHLTVRRDPNGAIARGTRLLFAGVLLALLPAAPAEARRDTNACAPQAMAALRDLGISGNDVKSLRLLPERSGGERGRVIGIVAWARLHGKDGSVAVEMSTTCRVRSVFTRGGLTLPNVESY